MFMVIKLFTVTDFMECSFNQQFKWFSEITGYYSVFQQFSIPRKSETESWKTLPAMLRMWNTTFERNIYAF